MSCRVIISPITNQKVTSKTWNEIRNSVETDQKADKLYDTLTTSDFIAKFGNWVMDPESVKDKTNDIGEPFAKEVLPFPGDSSLNSTLISFLKKLGVSVEEYDELKSLTGFDVLSATDLLTKVIHVVRNNAVDTLPKETAYVAYAMLGKKNKIRTDLIHSIDQLSNYAELQAKYKINSPKLSNGKIKELIVVDFLTDAIKNNFQFPIKPTEQRQSEFWSIKGNSALEKQFNYILSRILGFIKKLFNDKLSAVELDNLANDIANDILTGDSVKYQTKLKPDQITAGYDETIATDLKAEQIITVFQKEGLILTGSLALRRQGSVYRSPENNIHDIDFTVPYKVAKELSVKDNNNLSLSLMGIPIVKMNVISESGESTSDKGEKIRFIKSMKETSWFKSIEKQYPGITVTNIFKGSDEGDVTVALKIDDYLIDFFIKTKPHEEIDTIEKGFQDWNVIMKAKVRMGRAKDLLDLTHYLPNKKSVQLIPGFRHFTFKERTPMSVQSDIQFNRADQEKTMAREIFEKTMRPIADKLGVKYQIITAEEAREITKDAKNQYNGESAFNLNGTAYILDSAINLTNGIHEIIHPFIDAVVAVNPELFSKLYKDLIATNTGAKILDEVVDKYSDFNEIGKQKEVLVRALTALAKKNVEIGEEKQIGNLFNRFWFALKQLLKKLFGSTIQVSEINENTTLQELANMLTSDTFKIETVVISETDLIQFNRQNFELVDNLEALGTDKLNTLIEQKFEIAKQHVSKVMYRKQFADVKSTTTNEDHSNQYETIKDILGRADKLGDEIEDVHQKARQLGRVISETQFLTANILNRMIEIAKDPDNQDNLQTMYYYKSLLEEWKQFYENLTEGITDTEIGKTQLFSVVGSIKNNINEALKKINSNNNPAILRMLTDQLGNVKESLDKDHQKRIDIQIASGATIDGTGNSSAQRRLNEEIEKYKKFDLSNENLLKFLKGEHGDTNSFSGFLEAAISSPDPIVGGFAKFIATNMYQIQSKVRNIDNDMRNELNTLGYDKIVNRGNVSELGKQITFLDKIMKWENGKLVEGQVVTILNPFKHYRADIDALNHKIEEAVIAKDKTLIRELNKEMNELEARYMNRKYKKEYYDLQKVWDSEIGSIAKTQRTKLFDDIKTLEQITNAGPEEEATRLEQIEDLWREYAQLSSLTDLNGNYKQDVSATATTEATYDLSIAKLIRQYNIDSRPFYEFNEKIGLFESRFNQAKQDILDDNVIEGSDEYKDRLQEWQDQNMKVELKTKFYEDRQVLLDQISVILAKLPDAIRKDVEVSPLWESIIDMTKGFRDDDGQPMGADMSVEKVAKIKELQERIIAAQDKYASISGLTRAEQDEMHDLYVGQEIGENSIEDSNRLSELIDKKSEIKKLISPLETIQLFKLFDQLTDLQSKQPTSGYLDIINNYLEKLNHLRISEKTVEKTLVKSHIDSYLDQDPEFKTWFLLNHIPKQSWDKINKVMVDVYERLYVWNKIVPNNPNYYKTYKLSTGETLLGTPKNEYFKREIKKEFYTGYNPVTKEVELKVGVHVDNKRNFLPRSIAQGQLPADSKYLNDDYEKLKVNNPGVFKILQVFTKYHLASQDGADSFNKLYMDLPRYRKEGVESLQSGKLKGDTTAKVQQIGKTIKSIFVKQNDDFQEGVGNFNGNAEGSLEERFVNVDAFGHELSKIPITGLSNLDIDQVSLDVGGVIMQHINSIEINKQLTAASPMAQAIRDTLQQNGVEKINSIQKKLFRTTGLKVFAKDDKNNRHKIITNLYDKVFLGMEHHMELGQRFNRGANLLTKLSAFGTQSINLPGHFKNLFAATIQGYIEGMNGKHINMKEYSKGLALMGKTFIPAMVADFNKFADHSYETQLMRMMDFVQGKTEDKLGEEFADRKKASLISASFLMAGQEFGEIEAQGGFGLGLMMRVKVKQTIAGVTKEISLLNAYELVNSKMRLKEGIDTEWGEGEKKFNDFKLLAHELSKKLQGNYAKINQAEMQRYTSGRLFNFMRRYLVDAVVNRMSPDRIQVGIGERREGYYMTSVRMFQNTIKDRKINWHLYTNEEKGNFFKTLIEVGASLTLYLLLRSLGWDPDDKEKIKKLEDNTWATNHLIYQLMAVKSETEQFIPVPGMGGDEIMRLINTPSIAFAHLGKWYKLLSDISDPTATLDQKSGFWDKGDNKLFIQMQKIVGFTGGTIAPEVMIKNYNLVQSRTK